MASVLAVGAFAFSGKYGDFLQYLSQSWMPQDTDHCPLLLERLFGMLICAIA